MGCDYHRHGVSLVSFAVDRDLNRYVYYIAFSFFGLVNKREIQRTRVIRFFLFIIGYDFLLIGQPNKPQKQNHKQTRADEIQLTDCFKAMPVQRNIRARAL
jgi:hypothetical protein